MPIPSSIADVGQGLEARGLADLGRGVTDLGLAMLEIEQRDRNNDDNLAAAGASIERQSASNQWKQTKEDFATEPEKWVELGDRIVEESLITSSQFTYHSDQTTAQQNLIEEAWQNNFRAEAKLQATDAKSKKAVAVTGATYSNDIATGQTTQLSEPALDSALQNEFGDDLWVEQKKRITTDALKERVAVLTREGRYGEAATLTSDIPDIKETERNSILGGIGRAEKQSLIANKTRGENQFNSEASKVEPDWLTRYRDGDVNLSEEIAKWTSGSVDPEIIRKEVDLKEEWLKKLDSKANENKTSEIYGAWVSKVDQDPTSPVGDKTLEQAIYAQVGPNPKTDLSIAEAEHLVTKLEGNIKAENIQDKANHDNAQKFLKVQFNAGLFSKANKSKTKERYNGMALQLTQFSNSNPEATVKQWEDATKSIKEANKKPFPFSSLLNLIPLAQVLKAKNIKSQIDTARDNALRDVSKNVPDATSFKVGDTQSSKDGTTYIMITKGKTPAEDVWQPIQ